MSSMNGRKQILYINQTERIEYIFHGNSVKPYSEIYFYVDFSYSNRSRINVYMQWQKEKGEKYTI